MEIPFPMIGRVRIHLRSKSTSNNGTIAIELTAQAKAACGQILGTHAFGLKDGLSIAILIIQPPTLVEQTSLGLQTCIQWRSRCRDERVELGQDQFGAQSEIKGAV